MGHVAARRACLSVSPGVISTLINILFFCNTNEKFNRDIQIYEILAFSSLYRNKTTICLVAPCFRWILCNLKSKVMQSSSECSFKALASN